MYAYNQKIQQYFHNPRFVGSIAPQKIEALVGRAQVGEAGRTHVISLHFRLDRQQHVVEVKFKTWGCGVAIAATAWLAERLLGKNISEISRLSHQDIIEYFHLQPLKHHCAILAAEALQAAVSDWQEKQLLCSVPPSDSW